jgi:hypothetical protein
MSRTSQATGLVSAGAAYLAQVGLLEQRLRPDQHGRLPAWL